MNCPAVSVGFDSQGDGPFVPGKDNDRFRIKSRGGYVMVSRNYSMLGTLGLHGGANYSTECDDRDYGADFWGGLDKSLGSMVSFCSEYDFARNDDEHPDVEKRNGYLNAALKICINKSFTLEFDLKNILRDDILSTSGELIKDPQPSREIRIYYSGKL